MGLCGAKESDGAAKDEFDYRKIEAYLRTHTSLAHVLSDAELTDFSRYFHIVDFLAGVSICADGDVGRDLYVIASGELSMYIEEELFCQKKENDYISFAARYPADSAAGTSPSSMRVEEMGMQRSASSGTGGGSMHTRHSAGSITEKPGFGKCLAVSTAQSRLIHLTRERWIEFQQAHTNDGDLCERIYQLVVEPSASLAGLNFFRGISARMLQNIGMMFRTVYLKQGEILFQELDEGHSLFIVSSGTAEAFVPREDGSEKILKLFKTGDILGEIALIMNVPRTATVRATSPCFLLELHRENFKKFVKFVPATGNIHAIMKARTAEHFRKYKVPFFNSIPDDKYIILAELCKIEQISAGQVVFREGDPANCFYIIAHGELKVSVKGTAKAAAAMGKATAAALADAEAKSGGAAAGGGNNPKQRNGSTSAAGGSAVEMGAATNGGKRGSMAMLSPPANAHTKRGSVVSSDGSAPSGHQPQNSLSSSGGAPLVDPVTGERELTRMGPGRYFGEIALVQDSPRTATVTALTRSVVLSITQENFQKFFEEAPEAIADFEVKLARYDVRLRSVLYHPVGLQFFMEHLKHEYSQENLEFWTRCRDFRHLSYADIPASPEEIEAVSAEMDREVEMEIKRQQERAAQAALNSGTTVSIDHVDLLTSPTARRQSLVRIQGLDVGAAFDLFVDAKAKSSASGGEDVMSLDSLVRMLRFFHIPLPAIDPDRARIVLEMAAQLGYDPARGRSFISRGRFERILVDIENGRYVEAQIKLQVDQSLSSYAADQAAAQAAKVRHDDEEEWALVNHERDPTTDYLPPDSSVAAASVASSSSPRSLSLASKLLLKLTRLILDLRVAKLRATFDLYDVDRSGSIELNEFQHVCASLAVDGHTNLARITAAFKNVDQDGSGSISLLEFVQFIFVEKTSSRALQSILDARAKEIYDTYISNHAPKQVNIRGPVQRRIQAIMELQEQDGAGGHVDASPAPTPKSAITTAGAQVPSPSAAATTAHLKAAVAVQAQSSAAGPKNDLRLPEGAAPAGARHAHNPSASASSVSMSSVGGSDSVARVRPRITQQIFDEAEEEIMKLMSADSFSRFKQSELFQQFLLAAGAYDFGGPSIIDDTKIKAPTSGDRIEAAAAAAATGAIAAQAAKPAKLRSGSIIITPRNNATIAEGIANLSDDDRIRTPVPAADGGGAASSSSSGGMSITVDGGGAGALSSPMEVEVVSLEQIGLDNLTNDSLLASAPAGSTVVNRGHRASLIMPPRNSAPQQRAPGSRSMIAPVGVTSVRALSETQSAAAMQTQPKSSDATPPAPRSSAAEPAPSAADAPATPPAPAPRRGSLLERAQGGDVVFTGGAGGDIRIHGPRKSRQSSIDVTNAAAAKTNGRPSSTSSTRSDSPPPPPPATPPPAATVAAAAAASAAASAPAPSPASPFTAGSLKVDDDDDDDDAAAFRPSSAADAGGDFSTPSKGGAMKNPLQSPAPPSRHQLHQSFDGDVGKNPLQSPAPPRQHPMDSLDKNPLQSPAPNGRRASHPDIAAFQLTAFNGGGVGGADSESAAVSSIPLPPLATLNDADLDKNPMQSPAFVHRKSQQDAWQDAPLPPPEL